MRYAIVQTLRKVGLDHDLCAALAADDQSAGWGHSVMECNIEPIDALTAAAEPALHAPWECFGSRTLMEACDKMSSFEVDPLWQTLIENIDQGLAGPDDEEWQFS
jgi:hypothetical protein